MLSGKKKGNMRCSLDKAEIWLFEGWDCIDKLVILVKTMYVDDIRGSYHSV